MQVGKESLICGTEKWYYTLYSFLEVETRLCSDLNPV